MVFKLIYKQDLGDIYMGLVNMCLNHSFWENFYKELKKLLKQLIIFSLFYKKFSKIGY